MEPSFILALDQGTTSSRAILFSEDTTIHAIAQQEFTQYFPQSAWVEHDANEIWDSQLSVIHKVLRDNKVSPSQIKAIGITNQRETTIAWNKDTGEPVGRAIVWQDRRTAAYCDQLKADGWADYIKSNTGLIIDAYFSGTKIKWILDHVEGAQALADEGKLLVGTVDSWLVWKLTQGEAHITDYSNAARTMLFNIKSLEWDQKLLDHLDIPISILPKALPSAHIFGHTTLLGGQSIPIAGIAGDQQAALFGQQCFAPGQAKNTYGTGCFMLMNTGQEPVHSDAGLLTTIAWGIDGEVYYALEGSIFIAGAAIQWLRDGLKMIQDAPDSEYFARKVDSSDGVVVVPAFAGLGAPHWDMYARGAIFGLTRGTTNHHLIRATLESLAFQTMDVLTAMQQDSGIALQELKVDGGASMNSLLMQFQSDILNIPVARPAMVETTAMGAAYLAGLTTGFWTKAQLSSTTAIGAKFQPEMEQDARDAYIKRWHTAIARTKNWEKDANE